MLLVFVVPDSSGERKDPLQHAGADTLGRMRVMPAWLSSVSNTLHRYLLSAISVWPGRSSDESRPIIASAVSRSSVFALVKAYATGSP